jgi:hypothetical protein
MSIVENKIISRKAERYCWEELSKRVRFKDGTSYQKAFNEIGIHFYYQKTEYVVNRPAIIVVPCTNTAWTHLLKQESNSLNWLRSKDLFLSDEKRGPFAQIPVLFWGTGRENGNWPFATQLEDGIVVFHVDIIAATFFMLTRWEETTTSERDQYGRFPATASVAYKQGFLDQPIIDEYALILREWIKVLRPNWEPRPRKFTIKLSHDIDHVHLFPHWKKGARTFLGDLVKRHDSQRAKESWRGTLAHLGFPSLDPYLQEIETLANISQEYGLGNDTFFFKTSDPSDYDSGYNLNEPGVRKCIKSLQKRGFEIGLHPGYNTYDDLSLLEQEKGKLDSILGTTAYGARQHYLQFKVPDTWRHFEQVGLTYDATLGYPEVPGFRCGTCHPFQPFDIEQNRVLNVWERPLIAMDRTFQGYQHLLPNQIFDPILQLAQRCQSVGGEFTLLWHNSSKHLNWRPSKPTYTILVQKLAELL